MKRPNVILIAAVTPNFGIGKDNKLLYTCKEDMSMFSMLTFGWDVIMGRNTFESIGKPLTCRNNIVISSRDIKHKNLTVVRSIEDALRECKTHKAFVIGGSMLYKAMMPMADELIITHYEAPNIDGTDAFFPEIDSNMSVTFTMDVRYSAVPHQVKIYERV